MKPKDCPGCIYTHEDDCKMECEDRGDPLAEEFRKVSEPVIEFLNKRCHPHASIIITTDSAELVESKRVISTDKFI